MIAVSFSPVFGMSLSFVPRFASRRAFYCCNKKYLNRNNGGTYGSGKRRPRDLWVGDNK